MEPRLEPIRILHLVDPGSPGGGACTLRLLAEAVERIPSVTQCVLVVGNAEHAALASRCGLRPAGRVSPPAGATALARRAVVRALPMLEREHGRFDIVQAWTANAATLATLVAGDRHRLGILPIGPLDGIETEAFGTLLEQHPMPLLALGPTIRHEHAVAGIDPDLLFILPPGINHDVLPEDRALARAEIRRRWKVGS
ncbi:MAG: hypothetical protein KDA22_15430, partial [Phycisphaerales bacterium]|nr:hypothetical protein [Phycisphaerales bacterium]